MGPASIERVTVRLIWQALALLASLGVSTNGAMSAGRDAPAIVAISAADLDGKELSILDGSSKNAELISGLGTHFVEVPRYTSADRHFESSVKHYERVTLRLIHWPIDEFMHILKGSVTLTDSSGHSHTYTAGDSFLIPKNFDGEWKQLDTVEMVTVSYHSN
jgi:uncharacterized cupin superfamily protein